MLIDLQVHTTASDGTWSLEEIVQEALRKGLSHIAITDHDTIDALGDDNINKLFGLEGVSVEKEADQFKVGNLVVIQGEEVTCQYNNHEIHLLAYFLEIDRVKGSELEKHNLRIKHANTYRALEMAKKLREKGYVFDFTEMSKSVNENPYAYTRELIAKHLLSKNEQRLNEEFKELKRLHPKEKSDVIRNQLLKEDGPFYLSISSFYKDPSDANPVQVPDLEEAVQMILSVGGIPVLSHPGRYSFVHSASESKTSLSQEDTAGKVPAAKLISDLMHASKGLAGVEVFNRRHHPVKAAEWLNLAKRHNAFYTAGSDFHGDPPLGIIVSDDVVAGLYSAREKIRPAGVKTFKKDR